VARSGKHRIVYIEDDADMISLVQMVLDPEHYELVGATDGSTGLAMIRETPPDLVLLDLMLPDIGGWSVYQTLKEDEDLYQIPVIVITAQNTPIDRVLGEYIAKVEVYLTKPFSPQGLRAAVNTVLSA
jgi:two-component system, OmpR family, response regulator VicR